MKELVGNCPKCSNVIIRRVTTTVKGASFEMKCPACQELLIIEVKANIKVSLKK